MPPLKKRRKRRTTGYNLCDGCGYPDCNPMNEWRGSIAGPKIRKRLEEGKCMGCGQLKKECNCKSD